MAPSAMTADMIRMLMTQKMSAPLDAGCAALVGAGARSSCVTDVPGDSSGRANGIWSRKLVVEPSSAAGGGAVPPLGTLPSGEITCHGASGCATFIVRAKLRWSEIMLEPASLQSTCGT